MILFTYFLHLTALRLVLVKRKADTNTDSSPAGDAMGEFVPGQHMKSFGVVWPLVHIFQLIHFLIAVLTI